MSAAREPTSQDIVAYASYLLEISEFELFEIAWRQWQSSEPDEKELDRLFGAYLDRGELPYWVRDFARSVINDPQRQQLERQRARRAMLVYYLPLVLCFILFMYVLLWRK